MCGRALATQNCIQLGEAFRMLLLLLLLLLKSG
jgi:hypothetical protein